MRAAIVCLPAYLFNNTDLFSELDIFKWQKFKFYQNDYWIDLFLDTVPRIDYRIVSKKEFVEKYEAKNIPVVITHVTDEWPANQHWTEEVLCES